jgi:outer membrane receptor for monomeric catechols
MVGGGVNWLGSNYLGVFGGKTVYSKSYYLVSALAGYDLKVWKHNVRLQLNVNNLFDDAWMQYVNFDATTLRPTNYRVAASREFRLSATTSF